MQTEADHHNGMEPCAPALDAAQAPPRTQLADFTSELRVAYFSMEVALENDIPTYSGGLGVLAGDTLRSAADLSVPLVAVTLVSSAGYVQQDIDDAGRQLDSAEPWEPGRYASLLPAMVAVPIEGRDVWIRGWLYVVRGHMGGAQPVILLDTDVDQNRSEDRSLSGFLYGGDASYRLKQEIVLGIGGVRMLRALGFRVRRYHMNEGHSALLGLELLREHAYPPEDVQPGEPRYDLPEVRELCVFTTHTPVEAGHDQFPYDLVGRILSEPISPDRDEGDANALYRKLAERVAPAYYDDRAAWLRIMKSSICKNASFFNSHRMLRRYVTEAYLA